MAGLVEDIILPTKTYTLAAGEEVDTSFTRYGLYLVRTITTGQTGIVLVGTAPGATIVYGNSNTFVSDFDNTSSRFAINRKENNGNIFVKNVSTIERQFQIKQMKIF